MRIKYIDCDNEVTVEVFSEVRAYEHDNMYGLYCTASSGYDVFLQMSKEDAIKSLDDLLINGFLSTSITAVYIDDEGEVADFENMV